MAKAQHHDLAGANEIINQIGKWFQEHAAHAGDARPDPYIGLTLRSGQHGAHAAFDLGGSLRGSLRDIADALSICSRTRFDL